MREQFDTSSFFIPDASVTEGFGKASRRIAAVRLVATPNGSVKLGNLTQLGPDCVFTLCGKGYNERTVKVRVADECYFVFREDLIEYT